MGQEKEVLGQNNNKGTFPQRFLNVSVTEWSQHGFKASFINLICQTGI